MKSSHVVPRDHLPVLPERTAWLVAEAQVGPQLGVVATGTDRQRLGISTAETLRKRVRRAEVAVVDGEPAEIRRLKRKIAELRRANSILDATSCGLDEWSRRTEAIGC